MPFTLRHQLPMEGGSLLFHTCGMHAFAAFSRWQTAEFRLNEVKPTLPVVECSHLKSVILHSTMKIFRKRPFFQMVKDLQSCPWTQDREERNLLQSHLRTCCNATYSMIVTQENNPIGYTISYDGEEEKLKVTKQLYDLFPKGGVTYDHVPGDYLALWRTNMQKSPFLKPQGSCAVVGNGAVLNGSFCGAEIDKADFVFRMNFPPLNWTDDVGTKTNLVTANPSILVARFDSLSEQRKPFMEMLKEYGSSLILLPAFSYLVNTDVSLRVLYTMEDYDLHGRVVFFNSDYLKRLDEHWKSKGLKFQRMSTGLMLVSAAMEMCEKVTLYGFWPFIEDLNEVPIPHHYYNNVPPNSKVHDMPDEFYQYLQMHVQGALRLHLVPC
ncbi:alpha-2,8-sialyltransferase 8F-like [Gastrophryne carolinensis]